MPNIEPDLETKLSVTPGAKVVHVCVGVIERICSDTGIKQVLIAKRPDHLHQGGLWEFPGGKVEADETIERALNRELYEELGIRLPTCKSKANVEPDCISPLIQIQHAYPDKTVFLDVWKVHRFVGQAYGKEGQDLRWIPFNQINAYAFPAANLPIIASCLLPNRYFITPSYASLLEAQKALDQILKLGAELVYFRQPQLDPETYANWVNALISRQVDLKQILMLQQIPDQDDEKCAGVHLSFRSASLLKERPVAKSQWFSISCHNESELQYAKHIGADFVTLSPVLPTQSHPEAKALGWEQFKALAIRASLPVYGLGGLSEVHQGMLKESGSQGLAGISFWQ